MEPKKVRYSIASQESDDISRMCEKSPTHVEITMSTQPPDAICMPEAMTGLWWDLRDFDARSVPYAHEKPVSITAIAARTYFAAIGSPVAAGPSPIMSVTQPATPAAIESKIRPDGLGPEKKSQSAMINQAGSRDIINAAVELGNTVPAQERRLYDTENANTPLFNAVTILSRVGLLTPLAAEIATSIRPAVKNLRPLAKKIGAELIEILKAR